VDGGCKDELMDGECGVGAGKEHSCSSIMVGVLLEVS
jgi:hypothetical protein